MPFARPRMWNHPERHGAVRNHYPNDACRLYGITPEERATLAKLAEGRCMKETARELGYSYTGVRAQIRRVRHKLDCRTTEQLMVRAVTLGVFLP